MDKQLATFSLLSTQWQKYNKSYLDNFVPLFATLLVENTISNFAQKDYVILAEDFKKLFSLYIPAYLISSLVAKLLSLHFIKKERDVFIVDRTAIIKHGFYIKEEIDSCSNKQNKISAEFIKYCSEKYNKTITKDEANKIILSFIKENDTDIVFTEIKTDSTSEELFLVGKYVSSLFVEQPDLYKDFVNFAIGSIAFHAMYLAPIESESESLKKCVFFLDSSFIFPLLGIDSMQREEIIKEIIKEIHLKGGFIKIFQHSFDEIVEILETAKKYIESPMYDSRKANKALSYMRQEGFSVARVELIIASLQSTLKENLISIEKDVPEKVLGIDENELTTEINNNLCLREYESIDKYSERTSRDVNSIIYTYEKRRKIDSKNFIDAKYSFITENALVSSTDKKIISKYSENKNSSETFFPAAIPEPMLCAYLYIGSSNKAVENVSMSILATAFAAIRPNSELEALVKDTAKKLKDENRITEAAYNLVITSHLIKDCLAERTLNSYEKVNEDIVFELIEDAKDAIAIEERKMRKEAEAKVFENMQKDNQRRDKAKKKAKYESIFICIVKYVLLVVPYCFSIFSFFNFPWYVTLTTGIISIVFSVVINHLKSIKFQEVWKRTYKKRLHKAYSYFELNIDELEK